MIVIFGAALRPGGRPSTTLRWRVEAAFVCTTLRRARVRAHRRRGASGPSEASVMAKLLASHGVPSARILWQETGTDTFSSARAVARLLRTEGIAAPVYAASSAYHLPRCVTLL